MKRWISAALMCALCSACSTAQRANSERVARVKEIMKDVHTTSIPHPRTDRVLTVLPQIRGMGKEGERALIAMFQDGRLENLLWKGEAAMLLVAMRSPEGTSLVRALMERIAEAALIEDVGDRKDRFGELLGSRDAMYYLGLPLAEVLILLEDMALVRKMSYGGHTPKGKRIVVPLIERKPKETIPLVLDLIAGREMRGMKPRGRTELFFVLVEMRPELDDDTWAKAMEAMRKFIEDTHPVGKARLAAALKKIGEDVVVELPFEPDEKKRAKMRSDMEHSAKWAKPEVRAELEGLLRQLDEMDQPPRREEDLP